MQREELAALVCRKAFLELEAFRKRMLKKPGEVIYAKAYQIDIMVSIYEILLEISRQVPPAVLKLLLTIPDLLAFFYSRWLRYGDSYEQDLEKNLQKSIQFLGDTYERIAEEEGRKSA